MGILDFFNDCRTLSDRWRGLWRHRKHGNLSPMYCHNCGKFCGIVNDADSGGFYKIVYFCDVCEEALGSKPFKQVYDSVYGPMTFQRTDAIKFVDSRDS